MPPVAARVALYAVPATAAGKAVEIIVGPDLELVGVMVAIADAFFEGSATLVAMIVAVVATVTFGARNKPVGETVPAVADQVTATLLVSLTVALNCPLPPEVTLALPGEICTLTGGPPLPAGATVRLRDRSPPDSLVAASLTQTTNLDVPTNRGVPEMAPVAEFALSPAGNEPSMMRNW